MSDGPGRDSPQHEAVSLPPPLVAEHVDLRDFPYMPLEVMRLRDSTLALCGSPAEFRAAVLLWCVAWHQIPAASVPDDDSYLAHRAGFGRDVAGWRAVRPGALRGWVKCSDGRLYHPVVAEKARDAFEAKLKQRKMTEAARRARLSNLRPESSETDDKKGEGNGQKAETLRSSISAERSISARAKAAKKVVYADDFEAFWRDYPRNPNMPKPPTFKAWLALSEEDRRLALASLPAFRQFCSKDPRYRPVYPDRYLRERRFDGHAGALSTPKETGVFVPVESPEWEKWKQLWVSTKGRAPPVVNGGWWFPSLAPPASA